MPKRKFHLIPGNNYHVYNKAVTDNKLFIEEKNYNIFLSKIKKYLLDCVDILAYCLMPNHYHLLIQVKTIELPKAMQQLALSYSASFNKEYQRVGHLFQGRYKLKQIDDQTYLDHLSMYIHLNPSSAGLVRKPEDWQYSSYREYIGLRTPDFINLMVVLDLIGSPEETSLLRKQNEYRVYVEDYMP
jgi:REP element-mobilizing transposase RayT